MVGAAARGVESYALPHSCKGAASRPVMSHSLDLADFEHIYQLHSRSVYSLCLRMVGNRAEAELLTRDAFLMLFRQIDTYPRHLSSETLLYRFAVKAVRTRLRDDQAQDDTSLEAWLMSRAQGYDLPATSRPLPTGAVGQWHLKQAIVALPLDLRIVFVLHDILGCGHRVVAEILESVPTAAKSQLHEARLRLRELLHPVVREPACIGDDPFAEQCHVPGKHAFASAGETKNCQTMERNDSGGQSIDRLGRKQI